MQFCQHSEDLEQSQPLLNFSLNLVLVSFSYDSALNKTSAHNGNLYLILGQFFHIIPGGLIRLKLKTKRGERDH